MKKNNYTPGRLKNWLSFLVGYSWSRHYFSFRKHHVFIKTTEMYTQKNILQELSHEINVHIHLNNDF